MKFTISDGAPAAEDVADHFQTSKIICSMHTLNLCISHGIDGKDNTNSVSGFDSLRGEYRKLTIIVTDGGPFPEEEEFIHKLRALNFFHKVIVQMD